MTSNKNISIRLLSAALCSENGYELAGAESTHDLARDYVAQLSNHTEDQDLVLAVVKARLPEGYQGNTLDEVPRMLSDALRKGFHNSGSPQKERASASNVALALVAKEDISYFHTGTGISYALIRTTQQGARCIPIYSDAFRSLMRRRFFEETGRTIATQALNETLDLLHSQARYVSALEKVYLRIAGSDDNVYYDLGADDGVAVEIDRNGWRIVQDAPYRFYRTEGLEAQLAPERGGDISELQKLLGVDDQNWIALLAFILACFMPFGPYPILLAVGEHGSGKSKLCELVKRIVDPNALLKMRLPREEHTLAIHAFENRLLVYDNVSGIRWDISDAICALVTGSGFSTRAFYSDNQSRTFKNARPVILNGIGDFADRHDLLDRAIPLKLRRLSDANRRTERQIDREFERALPRILGALFDIVAVALQRFNQVAAPTSVRMADMAQWLVAAEPATGLPEGAFLKALEDGVDDLVADASVNDPLVVALFELVGRDGGTQRELNCTVSELHGRLVEQDHYAARQLPRTAAHLSNALQRKKEGMSKVGLMVELGQRTARAKPVRVWIEANDRTPPRDDFGVDY